MREYCFPNAFNASCGVDSVVVMKSARYGRISPGSKCLSSDYKVGCWADVLQHLDRRCSGRRRCTIAIPDNTMHLLQPCQKDLFAYLEADYVCQKGFGQFTSLMVSLLPQDSLRGLLTIVVSSNCFCIQFLLFNY